MKLTQAVLKLRGKNGNVSISRKFVHLCRNVGSRCFSQAVVEEQLAACLFTALTLPFLPSLNEWQLNDIIVGLGHLYLWFHTTYLVHGEVIIVHVGVVALQLVELDVDDPLLVSLH